MKTLVAYESKYGATEGIAQRIGERLRSRGLETDVVRAGQVRDAAAYEAFVVGSAAYESNWRKDARMFVEHHADVLATHPTWLFSSGPLGTETFDKNGNDVLTSAEPRQFDEYAERLRPRGMQVFRGAYHHDEVHGADRVISWLPGVRNALPEGDFRDWDAIDAWADAIADELGASARV